MESEQSVYDVLREVRKALHVPETMSAVEAAQLHFARSVIATNIFNAMDSLVSSECDGEFVRTIIIRELRGFK